MSPMFPIRTDRLLLRSFNADDPEDVAAKFRLDSDPEIQRYIGCPTTRERSAELLREKVAEFKQLGYGLIALQRTATGEVVGFAVLQRDSPQDRLELILALLPALRGQRLASDAGRALLEVAFAALGEKEVIGRVDPKNTPSLSLLKALGMRKIGEREGFRGLEYVYAAQCGGGCGET